MEASFAGLHTHVTGCTIFVGDEVLVARARTTGQQARRLGLHTVVGVGTEGLGWVTLVPIVTAYQIEWNKLHERLRASPELDRVVALGLEADGWDTPLLVLGPERGVEVAERNGIAAMFISHPESGDAVDANFEPPPRIDDAVIDYFDGFTAWTMAVRAGASVSLNITGGYTIGDINVNMNITHTYVQDMTITF